MRYTHLDKLFTPEGLIVGAITLVVTVLLCRPKKSKTPNRQATKGMTTYHSDHAVYFSRFRDLRSPYEMRCALERLHMTRFLPVAKDEGLEYVAETVQGGLPCAFRLVYESADPDSDHYALHMRMSWAHLKPEAYDYYRKSAGSWFDLWSSSLLSVPAGTHRPRRPATFGERVAEARRAESDLGDVAGIQRKIVEALRQGATFSTAHKEGGTRIGYSGGAFYREDFGDNPAGHRFEDEAAFLSSLRRFFDWEISRGNPSGVIAEEVAWILILRRLD